MTTAILRNQAREAEQELRFEAAAKLYRQAIESYPTAGALADRDVSLLTQRAIACESMVSL